MSVSEPTSDNTPDTIEPQHTDGSTFLKEITRKGWRTTLTILPLVALANIGVLIWSFGDLPLAERIVRPDLLALTCLIVFIPMVVASFRLWLWGRFLKLPLSLGKAFRVTTGTMVTNAVTPSAAGGAPIKMMFLIGEGIPANRSVTMISFEWVENTIVLLSLGALALLVTGFELADFVGPETDVTAQLGSTIRNTGVVVLSIIGGLAAIALSISFGLFGKRAKDFSSRIFARVRSHLSKVGHDWRDMVRRGKGIAIANIALAAVQWSARFSIAGLVLVSLGTEVRPALFWLLQYLVQNISSLIPTPGGAGGAEASFLVLFAPFVPSDTLWPAMSMWRLIFFYLPLAGAAIVFFVLGRMYRRREKRQALDASIATQHPAE